MSRTMDLSDPRLVRQGLMISLVLFITILIAYLTRVSLSVALPFIASDYQWSQSQLGTLGGILLGVFFIGYGLSNVFISPLVDEYGPKRGLMIVVPIWALLTFLCGVFGMIYAVFIAIRLFLGISQGIAFPSASKVTQAWAPPERRSRMNAIFFSASGLSNLLSPLLLIPLILVTSWQTMFFVLAAACLLTLVPIYFILQDSPRGPTPKPQKSIGEIFREVVRDLRAALKVKGLPILIFSFSAANLAWWGLTLWFPTFLTEARGFTAEELVWAASLPYLASVTGLFIGSTISDKTGQRALTTGSFTILGSLALGAVTLVQGHLAVILTYTGFLFFQSLMGPNCFSMLQGVCSAKLTCGATGIMNGTANGLAVFGPIIVGTAVAATGSFDFGIVIVAVLMFIGGAAVITFRRVEATCPASGPAP